MIRRILAAWIGIAFVTGPGLAADVDEHLPNDSDIVVCVNLRTLLESPLGKRFLRTTVREALLSIEPLRQTFELLKLDGMGDVSRITFAVPSITAADDRGFAMVHGKFDRGAMGSAAQKAVVEQRDRFKVHADDDSAMYEIVGERGSTFVRMVSDSLILIGTEKADLVDADRRGTISDDLRKLIESVDGRQAVWLAARTAGPDILPLEESQKQAMEKVTGVVGSIRVETSIRFEVELRAADEQAAEAVHVVMRDFLDQFRVMLGQVIKDRPDLAPLNALMKAVRASRTDKSVGLSGEFSAAQIEELLKTPPPER